MLSMAYEFFSLMISIEIALDFRQYIFFYSEMKHAINKSN